MGSDTEEVKMNNLAFSSICVFGSIILFVIWGLNNAYPRQEII